MVTDVVTLSSLIITTTSHEMCRISLKELPLYISRDSKTPCDIVPYLTWEIILLKCYGRVTLQHIMQLDLRVTLQI